MIGSILYWAGVSVAAYVALFLATWVVYVFAFTCKEKHEAGQLHPILAWIVRLIAYGIGVPMDVAVQIASSIPFLDPPRELLLTSRLKRYKKTQPNSWRGTIAFWLCKHMLNPFDSDGHC